MNRPVFPSFPTFSHPASLAELGVGDSMATLSSLASLGTTIFSEFRVFLDFPANPVDFPGKSLDVLRLGFFFGSFSQEKIRID